MRGRGDVTSPQMVHLALPNTPHMSDTSTMAHAPHHDQSHATSSDGAGADDGGCVCGLGQFDSDGGEDMDVADEDVLQRAIKVNDLFLELGHPNHVIVLQAVAILNEREDTDTVRTGPIGDLANKLATKQTFRRHQVETSLKALYGREDDEVRYVDRSTDAVGNAYNWQVTERGRGLLEYLYELGIIQSLAESVETDD